MSEIGDWASVGCLAMLLVLWIRLEGMERRRARRLNAFSCRLRAVHAKLSTGTWDDEEWDRQNQGDQP